MDRAARGSTWAMWSLLVGLLVVAVGSSYVADAQHWPTPARAAAFALPIGLAALVVTRRRR